MKEISPVVRALDKYKAHFIGEVEGCSEEEVKKLEQALRCELPPDYREFLLVMGRKGADLFADAEVSYSLIPQMNRVARNIARQNDAPLPGDSLVFYNNKDYAFLYFAVTPDDPDPEIYLLMLADGEATNQLVYESFADYLRATVDNYGRVKKRK